MEKIKKNKKRFIRVYITERCKMFYATYLVCFVYMSNNNGSFMRTCAVIL